MAECDADASPADLSGLRELFDSHFAGLVGLARLLGARDPEDVAAEGFARLFAAWATVRDERAALAFVRTVVTRLVSNEHRHLSVVGNHQTITLASGDAESAEAVAVGRIGDGVAAALVSLTPARRAAVVLRFYSDLSHEQIGQALGCTTATARSHLRRGLADLRRSWRGEHR